MKKLSQLILLIFLIFFLVNSVKAQTVIGEQIKNFDSKIVINQDGTIDVIERIEYDFAGLQKHGIIREIPYIKTNKDSKKYQLTFDNFSVVDENGKDYRYSKYNLNERINLKIGDPDKLITGIHTYIISYRVSGALTYFSDHDELYWNVTGNSWTVPIISSTSEVKLPAGTLQEQVKIFCFTIEYISGSQGQDCTSKIEGNQALIKSDAILNSPQGLTLTVTFPKGLVAVLEPKEYVSFWNTILGKLVSFLIGLAALFWYLFLPFYIPIRWYLAGRDPSTRSARSGQAPSAGSGQVPGEVTAWYDPPKNKNNRSLTPGETGTLIDEKADIREVSATIIDLARRGYLKIVEKQKKEFSLEKVKSADSGLVAFEKEFLNNIFSDGSVFSLENNEMSETAEMVKNKLYDQLVADGSFPNNPKTVRTLYYALAIFALFTGNIFLAVVALIFAGVMPKKTVFGAQQLAVAKSLKKFLTTQERQLNFQAKEQYFFEKLLPYAVAFGVEKVWVDRFKDINLRQPDWYQGSYDSHFSNALFLSSLNSSFSKMSSSAMTPTRSSSGFSSGSSGGFSGGGGGGGGGGSW